MDIKNDTLSSITSAPLPSNTNSYTLTSSSSYTGSSNNSFFETIKNTSFTTWILIILILAFLGINVFVYLAKGTQEITDIFKPLTDKLLGASLITGSQVIDVSAEGAKRVVSGTANTVNTGLTGVQNLTPNLIQNKEKINTTTIPTSNENNYVANEASTSVFSSSNKAGWCYIGMDKGFRSCAEVGVNDTCMSGDIFPNQEICMNPNLRT